MMKISCTKLNFKSITQAPIEIYKLIEKTKKCVIIISNTKMMSRRYTMKGEAKGFKWIKEKLFEIPFFQRPYVWKEDNWEELWNNIVLNSAGEMPFIGSFILQIKDDRGLTKYTVIDGQQRLVTLSILIKAFLDSSSSDLKKIVIIPMR